MRFNDFNDEWTQTTLGDTLDYEQPTLYIVNNTDYLNDRSLIPVLTANKSFVLGYVNEENIYDKGECIILDDFTLDIKFVDFPFKVKSSAIKILTAKKGVNIKTIYNYLLFKNLRGQEKDHKRHYISEVQPLSISLPSLEEQKKIADFLSLIDERIQSCSETLKERKLEKAGLLNQLFSQKLRFPDFTDEWTQCFVSDFGKVVTGSTPPTSDTQNYDASDFLWASPSDLGQTKYIRTTKTMLSEQGFSLTRNLPKGSVLVSCIGIIGKVGIAVNEMSTNQQINAIIPNLCKVNAEYVYYAILDKAKEYSRLAAAQVVPILSKSEFERMPNQYPSLDEQKKIADFLSLIDERIETEEELLKQYEEQKKYLLRKMFV